MLLRRTQHKPTVSDRLTSLEDAFQQRTLEMGQELSDTKKEVSAEKKRSQALALDGEWHARFEARLLSYEQAALRISEAIEGAIGRFQKVQTDKAQADALALQVIGVLAGVGFSAGFGWAFTAGLGALGTDAEQIASLLKRLEGPANTAVSMSFNVGGAALASEQSESSGAPETHVADAGSGDITTAVGFMASNVAQIKAYHEAYKLTYAERIKTVAALPAEQCEVFDRDAQEAAYKRQYEALRKRFSGVEVLKPIEAVKEVIERHMWAAWIVNLDRTTRAHETKSTELMTEEQRTNHVELPLGGYVEDALNRLGVDKLAGVELSGHALWPNSPRDWERKLLAWAKTHREGVNKGSKSKS
jgi:hypothetical protein